ncbi:MAG: NTF2-like N-terminal transpeptidase domain-containing protein [Sellimonas intestinalis]
MIQKRRRSSRRKRTVLLPLILILVVLAIIGACVVVLSAYEKCEKEKPSEILKTYLSSIESGDYEKMFELVDSGKVSKKDFIARNQNIYEGIGCSNVKESRSHIRKRKINSLTL